MPVAVGPIAEEVVRQIHPTLPQNTRIDFSLSASRTAVIGDPTQIHQVITNLATNGLQAMPQGGVLAIELEHAMLESDRSATIGTAAAGPHLVLRVSDSGTGIEDDILDKIFDPFFTTKDIGVGTGLGLSLVHGIVLDFGGAIDVITSPGRGSTFEIYMPSVGEMPERVGSDIFSEPTPAAALCGNGERIVVVDDEKPLVDLVTQTLEWLGYRPTGFSSSREALAAFKANSAGVDALVTDEHMPGLTALDLVMEVRVIRPEMPVLLISGNVGSEVAQGARELGIKDVLRKPVLAHDLAKAIAALLASD